MLIKGLPGLQMPGVRRDAKLEKADALTKWKIIVGDANKHIDQKHVDFVGNALLTRAVKLSTENRIDGEEVFLFFLRVTQKWALAGQPVALFIGRLPNDLKELGIMKLAEEGADVQKQMGTKQ